MVGFQAQGQQAGTALPGTGTALPGTPIRPSGAPVTSINNRRSGTSTTVTRLNKNRRDNQATIVQAQQAH